MEEFPESPVIKVQYPTAMRREKEMEKDREVFKEAVEQFANQFRDLNHAWRISERMAQALEGDKEQFQKAMKAIRGRWGEEDQRRTARHSPASSPRHQWRTASPARAQERAEEIPTK